MIYWCKSSGKSLFFRISALFPVLPHIFFIYTNFSKKRKTFFVIIKLLFFWPNPKSIRFIRLDHQCRRMIPESYHPFVTSKKSTTVQYEYLGFSPKFDHEIIASQGFQIRKIVCDISFRCSDVRKILVLRFFNSAHKKFKVFYRA